MIPRYIFGQKIDWAIKETRKLCGERGNEKLDVNTVAKRFWQESGLETKRALVDDIAVKTIVHFTIWCSLVTLEGINLLDEAWHHFDNNQQAINAVPQL